MENIVERAIVPRNPSPVSLLNKEQYSLYAPIARPGQPGIAQFDDAHFVIENQIVRINTDNIATVSFVAETVVKVKSYADNAARTAENNAKAHANVVAQTAENKAKEYADTVTSNVLGSASSDEYDMTVHSNRKLIEENADHIVSIEETISSAEGGIFNHETRISANETNITNHEERISGIEQYLGGDSFIVDTSVAYLKTVPKNAVGKAKILSVGGMSYKCKNLFNSDVLLEAQGWTVTDGVYSGRVADLHNKFAMYASPLLGGVFKPNTQYTFSFDASQNAEDGVKTVGFYFLYTDGTSDARIHYVNKKEKARYTTESDPSKTVDSVHVTYANGSLIELSNVCCYEGKDTAYEPYFTGLRNAAVEEVKSEGVNKFDISKAIKANGSFTVSNGAIVWTPVGEGDFFAFGYWLDCNPNTNYTVSLSAVSIRQVYVYTDTFYGNRIFYDFLTGGKLTFNSGENTRLLLAFYSLGSNRIGTSETISNIQIEKGISATEYKPFVGTLDTFAIPQAVKEIDGYGLNENYIRWTENKVEFVQEYRREIVTSTSVEWAKYFDKESYYVYFGAHNGKAIGLNTSICSHFSQKYYAWDEGVVGDYSDHPNTNNVYFNSDKTTLEEWKAWLDEQNDSGNPVVLVYKLETPIVTDITDLISSYNFIKVEGGGTITAVNEHKLAAPSNIKYLVTYPKEV